MKLSGKALRRFNFAHLMFWLTAGSVLNWFFRNYIWWTNFMSLFAIILTVGTMWAASRTEEKQDEQED